ncbi:PCRF domain-containing protein, partial [Enterobacteriaceae endosymbiont of Donacia crassipes]|uniref:PCRF domain-containing protein n=1 Tax=Enterobacteriaceae endosymbiont of Donacia crassipes TaxID=2675776 RepID=UPI001FE691C6
MFKKLNLLYKRYNYLAKKLSDYKIYNNHNILRNLSIEYSRLSNIIKPFIEWNKLQLNLINTRSLLKEKDKDIYLMVLEDIKNINIKQKKLEKILYELLLPKNEKDNRNCFIEIKAGSGGNEAAIFVKNISRMYIRYAESKK